MSLESELAVKLHTSVLVLLVVLTVYWTVRRRSSYRLQRAAG